MTSGWPTSGSAWRDCIWRRWSGWHASMNRTSAGLRRSGARNGWSGTIRCARRGTGCRCGCATLRGTGLARFALTTSVRRSWSVSSGSSRRRRLGHFTSRWLPSLPTPECRGRPQPCPAGRDQEWRRSSDGPSRGPGWLPCGGSAVSGRAQLALVTGEAGIGQTRLVDELRERRRDGRGHPLARAGCGAAQWLHAHAEAVHAFDRALALSDRLPPGRDTAALRRPGAATHASRRDSRDVPTQ
jgi:hypothetical protein